MTSWKAVSLGRQCDGDLAPTSHGEFFLRVCSWLPLAAQLGDTPRNFPELLYFPLLSDLLSEAPVPPLARALAGQVVGAGPQIPSACPGPGTSLLNRSSCTDAGARPGGGHVQPSATAWCPGRAWCCVRNEMTEGQSGWGKRGNEAIL